MNAKPYVFAAAATVSIIVCFLSYSGTIEVKLLPPSVLYPVSVFYDSEVPPELDIAPEVLSYAGMSDILSELDAKPQKFSLDPLLESTISGRMGTLITFPPNALVDDKGNPPAGDVKIALYEYYRII